MQPDIEIYIKQLDFADLKRWLEQHFTLLNDADAQARQFEQGRMAELQLAFSGEQSVLKITPGAAGKAYASVWFTSNHTPWENDLACGRDCANALDNEIRCSAAGWSEEEELESEQWWVLHKGEERRVRWS